MKRPVLKLFVLPDHNHRSQPMITPNDHTQCNTIIFINIKRQLTLSVPPITHIIIKTWAYLPPKDFFFCMLLNTQFKNGAPSYVQNLICTKPIEVQPTSASREVGYD